MSHKKKIAFVISSLTPGGAERVVTVLSNSLSNEYDVTLITLSKSIPFYTLDKKVKLTHCIEEKQNPSGLFQSLKLNVRLLLALTKILKKERIEVVIGFMRTSNILSILAGTFLNISVIISERNHPTVIDRSQSKFWKLLTRFTYPLATKVVIQTQIIKDYYQKFVKPSKLVIIPNPINPDFSAVQGIRKNKIITIGSLINQKAQHHLINVFSKINPQNWSLDIVGEGKRREELQKLIDDLGMTKKIKLTGRTKEVEKVYSSSKIFVLTSNFEGFPNVLLEAMFFGVACISTNCPSGPSDLIKDGVNGYLIPVGGEIELEKKLRLLMEDDELQRKFSKNAVITSSNYSVDKIKKRWMALIGTEQNDTQTDS